MKAKTYDKLAFALQGNDPVAQSVEHLTFNQVAVGSIPTRITSFVFHSLAKIKQQ